MYRDVIEFGLAIAFLCILGGIGFAIWSVAVAITALAGVVNKPLNVLLSNEKFGALKVEAEHSNHIGALQVEISNSHPLDMRLEPVELSNHIGSLKVQLEPLEILGGALQVEIEKGILPLEIKIEQPSQKL